LEPIWAKLWELPNPKINKKCRQTNNSFILDLLCPNQLHWQISLLHYMLSIKLGRIKTSGTLTSTMEPAHHCVITFRRKSSILTTV
jgi:hypothetical protein